MNFRGKVNLIKFGEKYSIDVDYLKLKIDYLIDLDGFEPPFTKIRSFLLDSAGVNFSNEEIKNIVLSYMVDDKMGFERVIKEDTKDLDIGYAYGLNNGRMAILIYDKKMVSNEGVIGKFLLNKKRKDPNGLFFKNIDDCISNIGIGVINIDEVGEDFNKETLDVIKPLHERGDVENIVVSGDEPVIKESFIDSILIKRVDKIFRMINNFEDRKREFKKEPLKNKRKQIKNKKA